MKRNDSKRDSRPAGFAELKRKARAVRARPRRKTGAGGSASPADTNTPIDPLASQNFQEKGDTQFANSVYAAKIADVFADAAPIPPPVPLEPPASWRAAGHLEVLIYCRPLNPRLLLIRTDAGENGRVAVKPELQRRFGTGTRIWVIPTTKPGFYELVGRYNQWGRRVLD